MYLDDTVSVLSKYTTLHNLLYTIFTCTVRSMSPPTHDVTQEEKASADLSRLRTEVVNCLLQIKNARLQNLHRGSTRRSYCIADLVKEFLCKVDNQLNVDFITIDNFCHLL